MSSLAHVAFATTARVLIRAARRALERGDIEEFERLYDEADEQVKRAIEAMPGGLR